MGSSAILLSLSRWDWVQVKDYSIWAISMAGKQLVFLFAIMLLLAYLMQLISAALERQMLKLLGYKAYIWLFGWLGVPVHELGHLFFCIIFGHKVNRIVLFNPDATDGSLGHVNHSYNTNNFYHRIGNFFIGIGPIIFGSAVVFALAHYLLGIRISDVSAELSANPYADWKKLPLGYLKDIYSQLVLCARVLWQALSSGGWKSIVFVYAVFAIGSNITLSKADMAHILPGLFTIVIVMVLINFSTLLFGMFFMKLLLSLQVYLNMVYAIIFLVMLMSLPLLTLMILINRIVN